MSQSSRNTVYMVTGGNRGIGLGVVKALLARPHSTVIASVRNIGSIKGLRDELSSIPRGVASTFVVVTLDLEATSTPEKIREQLMAEVGNSIQHIDVLISNAAQTTSLENALETSAEQLRSNFDTNSIAPLILFQALWPLMKTTNGETRAHAPKVLMISSSVGSIEMQEPLPGGAYGPSKAALNWITKRLHWELEGDGLVSVAVHPGWVQTRMGTFAAKAWNFPGSPPQTLDQSVKGILDIADHATRGNMSGKFVSFDGQILAW